MSNLKVIKGQDKVTTDNKHTWLDDDPLSEFAKENGEWHANPDADNNNERVYTMADKESSLGDKMDCLRADIEETSADILEDARQAEFYSKRAADKVRLLNGYRVRLSGLVQQAYRDE